MKKYTDFTLNMMTKENLIAIIRRLEDDIDIVERMNATQFNLLAEKDLYRWHDLRKDPNDLPELGVEVLTFSSGKEFYVFWMHSSGWVDENGRTAVKPIAWRYIEPFTEDKE